LTLIHVPAATVRMAHRHIVIGIVLVIKQLPTIEHPFRVLCRWVTEATCAFAGEAFLHR
jgi:hypothetical protein